MAAPSGAGVEADTEALLRLRHLARAGRAPIQRLTGMPGGFVSKRRGRGLEPDDIRVYAEGDDIRHLDKNTTARTGTPHVRTFRDERDRTVLLLADFRRPMRWGTRRAFRSVAAAEALALTGWLAADAGARVGLLAIGPSAPAHVAPQGRARGMIAVAGALSAAHRASFDAGGDESLDQALRLAGNSTPSGATIALATALDDPGPEFDLLAARLAGRGRLCVLLIRDAFEDTPPPGYYPYVTAGHELSVAEIGKPRTPDDGRIVRLRRLGADVFPIAAGKGPEAMEVPGD